LSIILGALVGVVTGLLVSLPALRLRGMYLGIVTLVLPIILTGFIFAFSDFTGGENGLFGIERISRNQYTNATICFVIMIVSVLIMWKLTDTGSKIIRTGIVWSAIREDEIGARMAGINTIKYKVWAFAISGFFAGIVGGLYAHLMGVVGPSTLEFLFALLPVVWSVFGGAHTIWGPIVGVMILQPFSELLLIYIPDLKMIIFTGLVVVMLLFMPEGVGPWVRDKLEVHCPRCRVVNARRRKSCRACRADLHAV
jgi:branched-chain amino acid transport system permease protein